MIREIDNKAEAELDEEVSLKDMQVLCEQQGDELRGSVLSRDGGWHLRH